MALNLKVPFVEKEDALEFQKYLKKNGCQSRLETDLDSHDTVRYNFTIGAVEKFLDDVETKDKDQPVWETEEKDVVRARTWITDFKKNLLDFYATYEIGSTFSMKDVLSSTLGDDLSILEKPDNELNEDEHKIKEEVMMRGTRVLSVIPTLQSNHCLEQQQSSEQYTLVKKIPVEDINAGSASGFILGCFAHDDLVNAGIRINMQETIANRYTVIAGYEYLQIDVAELQEYLSEAFLTMTEDEKEELINNVLSRNILVHRILKIVSNGPISVSDLIDALFEEDDTFGFNFDVLEEAMEGILGDLKKLELISVKNGQVKLMK